LKQIPEQIPIIVVKTSTQVTRNCRLRSRALVSENSETGWRSKVVPQSSDANLGRICKASVYVFYILTISRSLILICILFKVDIETKC
jgi:hypothetical protein